jgi:hypothetical protein
MREKDDLLSNCFLTWTSILEQNELSKKKIEMDHNSEKE